MFVGYRQDRRRIRDIHPILPIPEARIVQLTVTIRYLHGERHIVHARRRRIDLVAFRHHHPVILGVSRVEVDNVCLGGGSYRLGGGIVKISPVPQHPVLARSHRHSGQIVRFRLGQRDVPPSNDVQVVILQ